MPGQSLQDKEKSMELFNENSGMVLNNNSSNITEIIVATTILKILSAIRVLQDITQTILIIYLDLDCAVAQASALTLPVPSLDKIGDLRQEGHTASNLCQITYADQ